MSSISPKLCGIAFKLQVVNRTRGPGNESLPTAMSNIVVHDEHYYVWIMSADGTEKTPACGLLPPFRIISPGLSSFA